MINFLHLILAVLHLTFFVALFKPFLSRYFLALNSSRIAITITKYTKRVNLFLLCHVFLPMRDP